MPLAAGGLGPTRGSPASGCRTPNGRPYAICRGAGGSLPQYQLAEQTNVEGPSLVRVLDELNGTA